jgi:hypothetical protein
MLLLLLLLSSSMSFAIHCSLIIAPFNAVYTTNLAALLNKLEIKINKYNITYYFTCIWVWDLGCHNGKRVLRPHGELL